MIATVTEYDASQGATMNDNRTTQSADAMGTGWQTSIRWLALVLVVVVASGILLPAVLSTRSRRLPPAFFKIRDIEVALGNYAHEHGNLPFDERGPTFALYKLHELVDAKNFLLNEGSKNVPPEWDHATQQLRGGDVIYINQPISKFESGQIVFMAKPKPGEKWTWVGHVFGGPRSASFAMPPDERILGSFRTVVDFYVVGERLYDDLASTHVVVGHSWASTSSCDSAGVRLMSSEVAGRSMRYSFDNDRLVRCVIHVRAGEITEEFETDELGQITAVRRTPENWRQLLGELEDAQDNKGSR